MKAFEIGVPIPEYKGIDDGIRVDFDENGMFCLVTMDKPTEKEVAAFKSTQPAKMAITFANGLLFFLFKFGDLSWMDAPHNPYITKKAFNLQEPSEGQGLAMMVVLIDTSTGAPMSIRLIGLPTDATKEIRKIFSKMKDTPMDSMKYDVNIQIAMASYRTEELLRYAGRPWRIA